MDLDPLRIAVRALFAFVYLLALLRLTGKRSVRQGTPFDFVLTLVIGDLVDNAIWGEVPVSQFVVAAATLVVTHMSLTWFTMRRELLRATHTRE